MTDEDFIEKPASGSTWFATLTGHEGRAPWNGRGISLSHQVRLDGVGFRIARRTQDNG
jgi:hypothetical protein